MNEVQEKELIKIFAKAKAEGKLIIYFGCRDIGIVTYIGDGPKVEAGDVPEPSLCAYLEQGKYVALYGCDMSDFGILERLK